MKWTQLKQVFRKKRLKLIKAVEYDKNRCLIRISNKIEMEREIIKENKARFKLSCSSLISN